MTRHKSNLAYIFCALLIGYGAAQVKTYSVSHTLPEVIHQSNLPAYEAFTCDSILQAQGLDIQRQVGGQMVAETADSTKKKGGKP